MEKKGIEHGNTDGTRTKFDTFEAKFDTLEAKLDAFETKMNATVSKIENAGNKLCTKSLDVFKMLLTSLVMDDNIVDSMQQLLFQLNYKSIKRMDKIFGEKSQERNSNENRNEKPEKGERDI